MVLGNSGWGRGMFVFFLVELVLNEKFWCHFALF